MSERAKGAAPRVCPLCDRRYDDTFLFCKVDGSELAPTPASGTISSSDVSRVSRDTLTRVPKLVVDDSADEHVDTGELEPALPPHPEEIRETDVVLLPRRAKYRGVPIVAGIVVAGAVVYVIGFGELQTTPPPDATGAAAGQSDPAPTTAAGPTTVPPEPAPSTAADAAPAADAGVATAQPTADDAAGASGASDTVATAVELDAGVARPRTARRRPRKVRPPPRKSRRAIRRAPRVRRPGAEPTGARAPAKTRLEDTVVDPFAE